MALVASLFVARRVVRPLETLRNGVERISGGDMNARLDLKTGDEIEVLAEEFNKMTENLQQAYAGLEQKVAARTEELAVANERLKELDHLKSDFVSHVSHELRTPLTAIKGAVDLILREVPGPLTEKQIHYLTRVRSNTQHLAGLINDLLDLSKIESGKTEVKPSHVSLVGLVHEVVESLRPVAAEKIIALEASISEPSILVWADRDKINQVLMNLDRQCDQVHADSGQGYAVSFKKWQWKRSGFGVRYRSWAYRRTKEKRFLISSTRSPRWEM